MIPIKKVIAVSIAVPLLIAACARSQRTYQSPSGNILALEILGAEPVTSDGATVSVCFELPSQADWVLARLLGDVTLSDANGSASMSHFELLELSQSPPRRCDRLFFSRPGGFPSGDYTMTIKRLAATIPPQPDWTALQQALALAAPGVIVEPLPDDTGLSFGLIARPAEMTDGEAHDLVVGLAEPVVIGPWSIPVELHP